MKPNRIIASLLACASLVVTAQAVTTNVLDWTFNVGLNPTAPDTMVNPSGGNPQATVFGGNLASYYFGTAPFGFYGSPTGIWDMAGTAHMTLTLNLTGAERVVGYTVQIFQFADDSRSFYPGALSLSPSGGQFVSESVYVPETGSMIGAWFVDTYTWSSLTPSSSLSLDIASGSTTSPALMLDEVKLTVMVDVPEPSASLIAGIGFLACGIRAWLRRKG